MKRKSGHSEKHLLDELLEELLQQIEIELPHFAEIRSYTVTLSHCHTVTFNEVTGDYTGDSLEWSDDEIDADELDFLNGPSYCITIDTVLTETQIKESLTKNTSLRNG